MHVTDTHNSIKDHFKNIYKSQIAEDIKSKRPQITYLLTCIAAIWLLATVCPFVSLHMVLLDKAHVTLVTAKRLLS